MTTTPRTATEHLAEAERLLDQAHRLTGNYRDTEGRITVAADAAGRLASMATAHALIAVAMQARPEHPA